VSDDKPPKGNLILSQEPAGLNGTRLRLSGRLNLAVAGLLLGWTDDICTAELGDVELDLTALTAIDSIGALALTRACAALRRRSRCLALVGAEPPGPTVKVPDGGRS
jgi:anti-anti-sigma regulatory factor